MLADPRVTGDTARAIGPNADRQDQRPRDLPRHDPQLRLNRRANSAYHDAALTGGRMRTLSQIEKLKLFEGHALFGQLSAEDVDALLSHARFQHHRAGDMVFAKGSPGRSMMAVLEGSIRISSTAVGGREVVLAILHAGEIFGEIALLDGGERTADATAMTDCDMLIIDHRDFIPFLEQRGDLCVKLLRILCRRLRQTDEQVEAALFERLEGRVAKALIRLAAGEDDGQKPSRPIRLRVSQQELAGMVGASRESVNKQLHIWARGGFLELGKRMIVIRDPSVLEELV
jgi:CRP/FNR family transcriptional regulator, cyclic AMP receptor protein